MKQHRAEAEAARDAKACARVELENVVAARNAAFEARGRELAGVLTDRPPQLGAVFNSGSLDAFRTKLQEALEEVACPDGVPTRTDVVAYRPEARELLLARELPRTDAIPTESQALIVKGEARPVARKDAESRHLYGQLLARTRTTSSRSSLLLLLRPESIQDDHRGRPPRRSGQPPGPARPRPERVREPGQTNVRGSWTEVLADRRLQ